LSSRPTRALIDLDALGHNYRRLCSRLTRGTVIMAVVKADAYGHGAARVGLELERLGCPFFAVALASEGVELRRAGLQAPVLVLGGVFREDMEAIFSHDLTPVIHSVESASLVQEGATARGVKKAVHLKIDTGMARIGIRPKEALAFLQGLEGDFPNISLEGMLSHFAESEAPESAFTARQLKAFKETAALAQGLGMEIKYLHMANSAAMARLKEAHFNMVRPGIMLYGACPAPDLEVEMDLRPVMKFTTEVLQIKRLPAGSPVSYGRTFVTTRDSLMATLPVGYGDGLPRSLSNRGHVLIRGVKAPIRGLVCMDLTVCDVTDIEGAAPGDEAVLIGAQGPEEITAREIAAMTGTISYEVFCNVSGRVPRVFTGGGGSEESGAK